MDDKENDIDGSYDSEMTLFYLTTQATFSLTFCSVNVLLGIPLGRTVNLGRDQHPAEPRSGLRHQPKRLDLGSETARRHHEDWQLHIVSYHIVSYTGM